MSGPPLLLLLLLVPMVLLLPIALLGAAEEPGVVPELAGSTLLEEPDTCAEEDGSPTLDDGAPEEGAIPDDGALLEPKGADEDGSIPEDTTTAPDDDEPPRLDAGLADDAGSMTLLDVPSTDVEAAPELEEEDVPMG